ncbi:HORMA domain-containing protein [Xylaria intraflava]|nr:HORMA domain-containing protein [Xylaria intraflava]
MPPPPPPPAAAPGSSSLSIPQANRLITKFTQFLTVCIHNILFYREVYPPSTFLTSRAYNLPVHQSRHPDVCAWVRDAVDAASAQIAQGAVERLAVVIFNDLGAVVERWVFDLSQFPAWKGVPKDDRGKGKARGRDADDEDASGDGDGAGAAGTQPDQSRVNWTDVDEQLRAAMRRLAYTAEKIEHSGKAETFTVAVELRDDAEAPIGHPQPWVAAGHNSQTASNSQATPDKGVGGATTIPIRAVEAGPLFFECWVEGGR